MQIQEDFFSYFPDSEKAILHFHNRLTKDHGDVCTSNHGREWSLLYFLLFQLWAKNTHHSFHRGKP